MINSKAFLTVTTLATLLSGYGSLHAETAPIPGDTLPPPPAAASSEAATTLGLPSASGAAASPSLPPVTPTTGSSIGSAGAVPPASSAGAVVPLAAPGAAPVSGIAPSGGPVSSDLSKPIPTPQIVQDAVSRLQKPDQINLDDMIRAQDAINRLDLLLEIEKRQTELKKIRDERNKPQVSSSLLGGSIPASVLNLPTLKMPSSPSGSLSESLSSSAKGGGSSAVSLASSSGNMDKYSIKRITGNEGRYLAVINTGDGKSETAKTGDKLGDGSKVKSISLTEVVLVKDNKSKTLTIPSDSYIVRESGNITE